jgi:phosphoribosylaminoimidazolecarboxamide formyltransferase/IMP cyclohydrolase
VEIFSTGGTKKALVEGDVPVHGVSELTGFPEILDGRVKTLHPAIHGGILAKRSLPSHLSELAKNHIGVIDMVAVNLYPFAQTIAKEGTTLNEALENIDIGGPTMIRAAAKNFPDVIVVVDPADYDSVLALLQKGEVSLEERKRLAQKAFQHVAIYDTAIAQYLRGDEQSFPQEMTIAVKKLYDLRYGENPHQKAAFYVEEPSIVGGTTIASAKQLWGKELSHNNIMDADAAWNATCEFLEPTVVIVKHTNPCGLASHADLTEAYRRALAGDPVSAFGGIMATNRPIDLEVAKEIGEHFYEIVIAPGYEEDALALLKHKKNLRILDMGAMPSGEEAGRVKRFDFRRVKGGLLVQNPDLIADKELNPRPATERKPSSEEMKDLLFGWRVVKHVKSNAIVVVKDSALLGMGAGQPNRVTSVHLALRAAGASSQGSVLASDAFFPFADGVELAAEGGVTAIIQPGGSIRDGEVIEAANRHNIAMVFTGARHFKH